MDQERLLTTFCTLVQIDSESGQERKVADYLLDTLKEMNIDVFEDDSQSITGLGSGNLIAFVSGSIPDAEPLLLNAHIDTVRPGTNIQPQCIDGVISSKGETILGADDKAGVAAILEMLRIIKEQGMPHGDVQIIFTVGEEIGLLGAKAIDPAHLKAQVGYALDTGGAVGGMKTAAPGAAEIKATVNGITAHAGVAPEKGVSAIEIAAKAVAQMELGRIDFETTANIGTFSAVGPTNVVADRVEIIGEVRSFNQEKLAQQVDRMLTILEETASSMGGKVQAEAKVNFSSIQLSDDSKVVRMAASAAAKIGRTYQSFAAGGGSDANIFNGLGVEMGVLACGYEDIHTTKEKMPIGELQKLVALTVALVEEAAKGR
ncbi:peptidase T-like protein [Enterococcus sp. 8G7_MSG3316]|uniref:Peptidase T-like protein n=1 Tax=Candidatus Enterococcus testudinis TaxID=1834191 RepID=A0A242A2R5_9ENTE|nr:M20/M25/M40 family metallo-hydrolase [Enterococcus sp. 8G7_MSG3316]OTN75326.1 peptidase T-like protein [Enterococcus sp. 8G7_MSG3316]